MGFIKNVLAAIALPPLLVLFVLFLLVRGIVRLKWSLRVLAGKEKAGPRETWTDKSARREFKARWIEFKEALKVFMVGIGIMGSATGYGLIGLATSWAFSVADWLLLLAALPAVLAWFAAMLLVSDGLDEWHALDTRLKRRYTAPVLL